MHYFIKELGLKPIAFSYDWGMITDLAHRNQKLMCNKLGIELKTVSANIARKRANIRKNIIAWLKKPDLGMIPLFMAGDKQYFYYANKVRKKYKVNDILMASNPFERTFFKAGFCGVKPAIFKKGEETSSSIEKLSISNIIRMCSHYTKQYITNPGYINLSLADTIGAAFCYYAVPHNYLRLYDYIQWNEEDVNDVLINEYNWEKAIDTESTWRIGDGTAPFYNYIYYLLTGFTENDTLRSNQIREGMINRNKALDLLYEENLPRFESLKWYFDVIGLDMDTVLTKINQIPRLY